MKTIKAGALIEEDIGILTKDEQKTDFSSFKDLYSNIIQGDIVAICGRPSTGKTSILFEFISNRKRLEGERSVVFSVKTQPQETIFGLSKFFKDNTDNLKSVIIHSEYISNSKQLVGAISDFCYNNEVDTIYIDNYDSIVNQHDALDLWRLIEEVNMNCKVTFVFTSTLSRNVEIRDGDKKPRYLSDITFPEIEKISSKIYFLYRPEIYEFSCDEQGNNICGKVFVDVLKNKNGKIRSSIGYNFVYK